MQNKKITNKEREFIKRKFKRCNLLIIVLFIGLFFTGILLCISEIKNLRQAQKHLEFTLETGEYLVFSAQLVNHCAEINNMTFDEVTNSYLHKMIDEELNTIDRKNEN